MHCSRDRGIIFDRPQHPLRAWHARAVKHDENLPSHLARARNPSQAQPCLVMHLLRHTDE